MTTRVIGYLSAVALVIAACTPNIAPVDRPGEGQAGEGAGGEGGGGKEGEGGGGNGGAGGGEAPGARLAEEARAILQDHCGDCHRGTNCGSTGGGFGASFDVDAMIACGHVVPGSAEDSRLWQRIESKSMPPTGSLGPEERGAIQSWIDLGAPAPPAR